MTYRAFLEEAARSFEAKYPGTKVHVETFSAMPEIKTLEQGNMMMTMVEANENSQDRTDYINRINTGLMSGGGADIFAMDVLPIYKFADSGQLENLATYMNTDPAFNKSEYRTNVIEAGKYRDGLWFLPMDYTFKYYTYDSTLINSDSFGTASAFSAEKLFNLGAQSFDGSAKLFNAYDFLNQGGDTMAELLFLENISSFVDLENRKANFANGSFAAMLESVKKYGELGYIPQGITGQGAPLNAGFSVSGAEPQMQGGEPPVFLDDTAGSAPLGGPLLLGGPMEMEQLDRYYFKSKDNFSLLQQFSRGTNRMMMIRSAGNVAGIEDDDEIAGIQANADGTVPFDFNQGYGINANSKNKRLAWEFLKYLLSEDLQLSTATPNGLPINNAARQQKAEMVLSGAFMGRGEPELLDEKQREVLRNYTGAVESLSDRINSYIFKDEILMDMIAQEASNFFTGTRTAEEAARTLQNKADMYLNE
jgi:multiple sugar transport system substrate-binding protein